MLGVADIQEFYIKACSARFFIVARVLLASCYKAISKPAKEFLAVFHHTLSSLTMKAIAALALPALAAAHGYVERAIIGGEEYEFYLPDQDPYMDPMPDRVSRPIPGNGPVEDLTSIDVQCNGYTAGGTEGSSPAALHATAEAGSTVTLYWTLWPESHMGPTITYMARCPDEGCDAWEPGTEYVTSMPCL